MKTRLMMLLTATTLSASLFCLPALAQTGPAPVAQGSAAQNKTPGALPGKQQAPGHDMQNMHGPRDCSQSPHPEQCKDHQEARQAAHAACQNEQGPAKRECMHSKMPPPDCSKASDPQRCEAHMKAREACKGKTGPEHQACLRAQHPAKPAPTTKP